MDKFQQVLFSGMGLDGGVHVVSIADSFVDADRPYLDIDSVRLDLVHSSLLLMGLLRS